MRNVVKFKSLYGTFGTSLGLRQIFAERPSLLLSLHVVCRVDSRSVRLLRYRNVIVTLSDIYVQSLDTFSDFL